MNRPPFGRYNFYAVSTASTLVVAGNAHRRWLSLSNPGANPIFVAFGRTAVANQDYIIPALTSVRPFSWEEFGGLITGDIFAIANTSSGFLAVIEGFSPPEPGSGTVGSGKAPFGMS